ncbi:putative secreted effector protein [Blumeria graminis f. sp. tritici 96224]|uniref:Putative secreted effector protein n=1 Tax=Blumeria graminis f. sp. tritici 96224 TaxID=1268274 RepID=A0A656KL87_BLUGR|nr:putative secreted effector protein [Blumeria graminis f. sp. tritici 96224]
MNFSIANSIMMLVSISSPAMAVILNVKATGNSQILQVPNQEKSFSITCGSGLSYDKSYLESSVQEGLSSMRSDSRSQAAYPKEITDFVYKVGGKYWFVDIVILFGLNIDQRNPLGEVDDDFVVFNNEGLILGGLHLAKTSPPSIYPCKFPDGTEFMP